ncbi:hypothetical protein ABFV83_01820 [Lacrimispora sp. BS-2]|uniref:Serine hydroxymethyltransferase-like domain-containing protein n=1 Tax=Lacrimispora sp. BS-2 TaxID=3151850 RepID=A0AAU7PQK9_9FIRM
MSKYLPIFELLCTDMAKREKSALPLCAAENVVSPFAKIALDSFIQEKYIMGGVHDFDADNNFMEAELLFKFYQLINTQCIELYHSLYADPRALSGVNAVMVLLMSIFKEGDTLLISSEDSGGHSSMALICKRLGISTIELPFDYCTMDFDYDSINHILKTKKIHGVLICPSDLLWQPKLENLILPPDCTLIYDATQTLGLMPHGANENPLLKFPDDARFILMGATHKTIPGPTCGLIMTRNIELAKSFDKKINPDYLRNVQFHHVLSLALVLMELEVYGKAYSEKIIYNANYLGKKLEKNGFNVIKDEKGLYTTTHQLFLPMSITHLETYVKRCKELGITLNARYKKLYRNAGIRLGLQEVTRYGWGNNEMDEIADIMTAIYYNSSDNRLIENKISNLAKNKKVYYTFEEEVLCKIDKILHNS